MNLMVKFRKQAQLAAFLLLLTGCTTTMSNNDTEFDWKATESGPENYPMQIIDGTFRYHGDPDNGLYVPSGAALYEGWGIMRSSHNVGPDLKPLPDKLDITYFSFAENKFYQGSFDLPYEKILSLFREGVEHNKEDPTYQRIMVGVAPGGAVAVWLLGNGIKEVFFGQALEADIDWEKAIEIDLEDREEFVKEEIVDTVGPEVLADIQKNGIPFHQWALYRTQYNWLPTFAVSHTPKEFGMAFYNGESGNFDFPVDQTFISSTHPVPKNIDFSYAINGQGKKYLYIIHFDEREILDAFDRLGGNQEPLQLEFDPKIPKNSTQIRLRNDKEVITLKKFIVEEF